MPVQTTFTKYRRGTVTISALIYAEKKEHGEIKQFNHPHSSNPRGFRVVVSLPAPPYSSYSLTPPPPRHEKMSFPALNSPSPCPRRCPNGMVLSHHKDITRHPSRHPRLQVFFFVSLAHTNSHTLCFKTGSSTPSPQSRSSSF